MSHDVPPKQGPNMESVAVNRAVTLGLFLSQTGSGFQTLSGTPKPKHGSNASSPSPGTCRGQFCVPKSFFHFKLIYLQIGGFFTDAIPYNSAVSHNVTLALVRAGELMVVLISLGPKQACHILLRCFPPCVQLHAPTPSPLFKVAPYSFSAHKEWELNWHKRARANE